MTSKVNEKTWVQKMEECLVKERKNGLTGNPQLSVVHGVSTENIAKSFCQMEQAYEHGKCISLFRTHPN